MHTTLGITTEGLPLGLLAQEIYARKVLSAEKITLKKKSHNNALPIEEKESIRWLNSMEKTVSIFEGQNEQVVTIADREADIYFKVIKSGFKVEDYRLEHANRLIRYLAVVSIVAWRVYWLTLVARTAPNASALLFLNDVDWKILFVKFNPNKNIPKRVPSMKQAIIWVAQLGGFMARKGDADPGITHIWRGLRKLADMNEGARILDKIYG